MVSLATLQTLLFTLGPLLLPRLISYYRTQRASSASSPLPTIPLPHSLKNALHILFISASLSLLLTLPYFSPENILTLTSSRLQTPPDVLFTRLSAMRPNHTLSPADELLRPRLTTLEARTLYLAHGPDTLTNCPFCSAAEPVTYLYYALPGLLTPHLLHLLALGLATSSLIAGKAANRWRNYAAMLGVVLACTEIYMLGTYDHKTNARVLRPEDLTHFHWRVRTLRYLAFALADAAFAGLLYLSGTNRMFGMQVSSAERVEAVMKVMEQARGKMAALGIVKNVVVRDEGLAGRGREYWRREKVVMGEVMDEREVVEGVRNALEGGRVRVEEVERDAGRYAEGIYGGVEMRGDSLGG